MSIEFVRPEVDGAVAEDQRDRRRRRAAAMRSPNMIASDVQGVDSIVANTDAQALNSLDGGAAHPAGRRGITQGPRRGIAAGDRAGCARKRGWSRWRKALERRAYVLHRRPAWAAAPVRARPPSSPRRRATAVVS